MNQASYERAAVVVATSGCRTVGIDITNLQLEYPLIALIREKSPETTFVHEGVDNESQHYAQPVREVPCAVVCLDCLNDAVRMAAHRHFAASVAVDKFVIFTQPIGYL